ncbi:MAG: CaiB/BaiF CoA-transferase family protein [Nitriliruptor sp.]|uniref:CaiB/BaiF CoA transferase family protein n=1 Tax=Nitriliruptor sp. TaxID=2448056 RepID=UPI0034A03B15
MSGPLSGIRVVEMSALGPAPYGVMLLADLGADVVRIDRASGGQVKVGFEATMAGLSRGRRSIAVDLKTDEGRDLVHQLVRRADVFVEGWRPGVAERLGLGPDELLADNPRLVYARTTGWGQDGPLAPTAGHDIGYAAIAGTLHTVGRADQPPPPPVNYLADFGGGGTFLAIGVLAALVERDRSGEGQVIDTAMVDGAASQTAFLHGLLAMGAWVDERESNLLDGAAPFYDTYACADGRFLAVGAIEPQFFLAFCEGIGVDPSEFPQQDRASWPDQKRRIAAIIATRTRDEWAATFDGTDACVAPVLSLAEAPKHPHNVAREAFVDVGGQPQPAPAPRFSRTPGAVERPAPTHGADTDDVLTELGLDADAIAELRDAGIVAG